MQLQHSEEKIEGVGTLKTIIGEILEIAIPAVISLWTAYFVEVVNTAFVGHLGDESMMAGVGMANMYINILAISTMFGINQTLYTNVSQAFGRGDYRMCGVYMNRARILITIWFFTLILLGLCFAETLFTQLGLDKQAAGYAQLYIYYFTPGLYFMGQMDSIRKLLSNMDHQRSPMVVQLITTSLHILWCYLFVDVIEMGVRGAALATSITHTSNFLLYCCLMNSRFIDKRVQTEAWFLPWKDQACYEFAGLFSFMKIALSSIGLLCLMWWSFEFMMLFSGWVSIKAMGAQIILLNSAVIFYMPALGLQFASSTLIGKSIGKRNIQAAKRYQHVLQLIGFSIGIFVGLLIYFCWPSIVHVFTNIEEVQQESQNVILLLALFYQTDAAQAVTVGILRGLGKFQSATIIVVLSYYIIALPLELVFGFEIGLGLKGLWIGQMCGSLFHALSAQYLVSFRYDWHQIAEQAQIKMDQEAATSQVLLQNEKGSALLQKEVELV